MIYDQAQLASIFAAMYQNEPDKNLRPPATLESNLRPGGLRSENRPDLPVAGAGAPISKEKFYEKMLRDVLTYVERDLKNDHGGFFSAEDADSVPKLQDGASKSKKKEGAFCVWTHEEIENLLGWKKTNSDISYATIFSDFFTIKSKGNVDLVKDPHGELLNQNVLINSKPVPEICKEYDLTCDQLEQLLDESKDILYKERLTRPKPRMDTKMITSWNAMMSSAFLSAAMVLNDSKFADISLSNFNFIKRHLFEVESGQLLRCCYLDNEKKICQIAKPIYGFVDDYAHVIATALDAYRWTNDDNFVSFACRLQAKMDELFFAEFDQVAADCSKMGAYYQNSPRYESILVPLIEDYHAFHLLLFLMVKQMQSNCNIKSDTIRVVDHDGAEPSANSVAVLNLLRLFNLTSKEKYLEKCKQVLEYFGDKLIKFPFTLPKMMCGLLAATESSFQIVIVGSENDPHVQNMFKTVNASFLPMASVILLNDKTDSFICCQNEHVRLLKYSSTKKPVAYNSGYYNKPDF
uniref:Uncharacterized protein n=1 Tax=Romanomermis culicivorax TaxID=13658 RepID=A0A915KEK3_ROMCU